MSASVTAVEFLRKTLAYPDWRGRVLYGILRGVFALVPIRRTMILEALARAFPEKDEPWRRATLKGIYQHYSWMIVEFLAAVNDSSLVDRMVVEVEGREIGDAQLASGKGCFVLSGHFGNWELSGAWLPRNGYPVDPAARDADDADFAALIERYRTSLGEHTLRKGAMNVLNMLRDAKAGRWIALIADQNAGPHALPVTFLGRRTTMVEGPAALALTAKLPLITFYTMRLGPFRHRAVFKPPVCDGTEGRSKENIAEYTQRANRVLEDMVRSAPEQWFWFHRRWKYDPDNPKVKAQ